MERITPTEQYVMTEALLDALGETGKGNHFSHEETSQFAVLLMESIREKGWMLAPLGTVVF